MLERMCGASAVVVGLHTAIKILCRTYVEAVVDAPKDICAQLYMACHERAGFRTRESNGGRSRTRTYDLSHVRRAL